MNYDLGGVLKTEQTMVKTAFLSYYISMYNSVNREIGFEDPAVTVDEIYEFIQDLRHECGRYIPEIRKEDISYCFQILRVSGVCRI
jgi:hypothetical protein